MFQVKRLEAQVRSLSADDYASFRTWLSNYEIDIQAEFEQWRRDSLAPAKTVAECLERLRRENLDEELNEEAASFRSRHDRLQAIFGDRVDLPRLEHDVQNLSMEHYANFRLCIRESDREHWNQQLEDDARAGKLDKLCDNAIAPLLWMPAVGGVAHQVSSHFQCCYNRLSEDFQATVQHAFEELRLDLYSPDYDLRTIGAYRCVSIWPKHRAMARTSDGEWLWFWLGTYQEYLALR